MVTSIFSLSYNVLPAFFPFLTMCDQHFFPFLQCVTNIFSIHTMCCQHFSPLLQCVTSTFSLSYNLLPAFSPFLQCVTSIFFPFLQCVTSIFSFSHKEHLSFSSKNLGLFGMKLTFDYTILSFNSFPNKPWFLRVCS